MLVTRLIASSAALTTRRVDRSNRHRWRTVSEDSRPRHCQPLPGRDTVVDTSIRPPTSAAAARRLDPGRETAHATVGATTDPIPAVL